jgi:replicative DNA helicase
MPSSTNTSQKEQTAEIESGSKERPFGPHEEKTIISLAFHAPEFFGSVGQHLDAKYFHVPEVRFIYGIIDTLYQKHEIVPTKAVVRDAVTKILTVDDDFDQILEIIDQEPNPKDIPIVKESLIDWAREKAFGLIYDDDAIEAYERGDYEELSDIIENAQRIVDVSDAGIEFFKSYKKIFEPDAEIKLTSGFNDLDIYINEGGPTRKEVFVWMAPTGVGKSLVLVNSGVMCFRMGLKVLHITLELSKHKTMMRYAGAFTKVALDSFEENEDKVIKIIDKEAAAYNGDLIIYEFPPEEIDVNTIYTVIKNLRRIKGWNPDVVIVDYLELMMSKRSHYNKEDYTRQKKVSTELRGLAENTNTLIFTATQTNRDLMKKDSKNGGGSTPGMIDVNRVAESYGKMMPTDYVVSLNQTVDEYKQGRVRFYIAKNRNGPKFKAISAKINYRTMVVEVDTHRLIS